MKLWGGGVFAAAPQYALERKLGLLQVSGAAGGLKWGLLLLGV